MISLAFKDGRDAAIPPEMCEKLGLGHESRPTRKIRYKADVASDHLDHAFEVLVTSPERSTQKPLGIVLTSVAVREEGFTHVLDGYLFRATLSGELLRAYHNYGRSGGVTAEEVPLANARPRFRRELNFYLKEAVRLDFVK